MYQYLFTYQGGHTPESPEEGQKVRAEWQAWFAGMGGAVAVPGAPVGACCTVTGSGVANGGGASPVTGYSVVTADDMDGATAMAKGCPILKSNGGSVVVSQVIEM